jgi:hypothetical protein
MSKILYIRPEGMASRWRLVGDAAGAVVDAA